jgi:pilus assembly protein CpaF
MLDARLADGSRVNAIIPPLALDGPCMSLRRFGTVPIDVDSLIRLDS